MYIQGSQNPKVQDSGALKINTFYYPIISTDATTSFELDIQSMDRLNRFRNRTMLTLGSSAIVNLYATEILKLAFSVGSCLKYTLMTSSPLYHH